MGRNKLELAPTNLDGAVRDEDMFVVGDDDDDEDPTLPPYTESSSVTNTISESKIDKPSSIDEIPSASGPPKYYIKRTDTLQGIALRFGVDVRLFSIYFLYTLNISRAVNSAG